jgi:hypothetical protein
MQSGATTARILAVPLLVFSLTGWIPNKELDLEPKGPWPWGAIVGVSLIVVAIVGMLFPRERLTKLSHSRQDIVSR